MRLMKSMVAVVAALAVMVGWAVESAEFRLDTMDGTRTARAVETIAYSTAWNNGGAVTVAVDGVSIKEANAPAFGDVVWNAAQATPGTHTLTHTCGGETLTAMFEVPVPPSLTLTAESANWSNGSITLRCMDADTSGRTHTYTLQYYDESTGTWKDVTSVQSASASASLTDTAFSSRLGGIPPVKYRVKDETGRASEPCVTRNRYLLAVGYTSYWNSRIKVAPQTFKDAQLFLQLCRTKSSFNVGSMCTENASTNGIDERMRYFSQLAQAGDLFVFYIATHGSDGGLVYDAGIQAYNADYSVEAMQEDIRRFSPSVAVVCVVVACHSAAMTGSVDRRSWIKRWTEYRFGERLDNVAWITSCGIDQYTSVLSSLTQFGEFFVNSGFRKGYADSRLHGTDYEGGTGDGKLTLGEMGRYARVFSIGQSDDYPAEVQMENEDLLDRIVMDECVAGDSLASPTTPTEIRASQGLFDQKISVSWRFLPEAKYYLLYRYSAENPESLRWVGLYENKDGERIDTVWDKILGFGAVETLWPFARYGYRVRAVNQVGFSELSEVTAYSLGWRGTSAYQTFLSSFLHSGATASAEISSEYATVESSTAANGCRTVGECYALGINPEDPNDDLRITDFKMEDGKPVITLNHTTDGSGNSFESRVKTVGKADLSDATEEWREVPDGGDPAMRFFKVEVEKP